jgi:drug/metabolite transporter (DMT)-like permease
MFEWNTFMIGIGVGLLSAILGGVLEFSISQRRAEGNGRLPGCMLLVTGALGFVGVMVTLVSWLFDHNLSRPLTTGLGVGIGFFGGFVLLMITWLLFFGRNEVPPEFIGEVTSGEIEMEPTERG